jgi:hypothetical protein
LHPILSLFFSSVRPEHGIKPLVNVGEYTFLRFKELIVIEDKSLWPLSDNFISCKTLVLIAIDKLDAKMQPPWVYAQFQILLDLEYQAYPLLCLPATTVIEPRFHYNILQHIKETFIVHQLPPENE